MQYREIKTTKEIEVVTFEVVCDRCGKFPIRFKRLPSKGYICADCERAMKEAEKLDYTRMANSIIGGTIENIEVSCGVLDVIIVKAKDGRTIRVDASIGYDDNYAREGARLDVDIYEVEEKV